MAVLLLGILAIAVYLHKSERQRRNWKRNNSIRQTQTTWLLELFGHSFYQLILLCLCKWKLLCNVDILEVRLITKYTKNGCIKYNYLILRLYILIYSSYFTLLYITCAWKTHFFPQTPHIMVIYETNWVRQTKKTTKNK
jgi:hypothetical protein